MAGIPEGQKQALLPLACLEASHGGFTAALRPPKVGTPTLSSVGFLCV